MDHIMLLIPCPDQERLLSVKIPVIMLGRDL